MLTALIISGMIVVICLIAGIVLVTVIVSQSLQKQADVLDRAHDRFIDQTKDLHNRLMAKDWQQYEEIKSLEEDQDGGFFAPGDDEEDTEPALRVPRTSLRLSAEEERLLAEDFDDDGEPIGKVSR